MQPMMDVVGGQGLKDRDRDRDEEVFYFHNTKTKTGFKMSI